MVYILADDMGYGDISAYNPESKIHTPVLDSLAASGIMFTDAHSNSSVSTPTRYGTEWVSDCLHREMAFGTELDKKGSE